MIDLPREISPWRDALDLFDPEVAEGIGPLLPRISLAIGPMRISRPTGDGEPDGFTGIARRGSYERLLLTEWLLADEAPLEFARRAATGEHAFFQIARRAPARAASSVVLFDAGPDQLGAPRVAHLGALIVLAARAERAGARFAWGILHRPEQALFPAVTKESVMSLVGARTAIGATADDIAAWSERAAKSGWEDAWIVGARTIVPGWKHGTVAVRDILDPDRRALAIAARTAGGAPREAELDLPPPNVTSRVLTNPFAAPPPPATTKPARKVTTDDMTPASNLVFAANGSKVFARSRTGDILSYPTENGRPKRYRPRAGGVVAAVGWFDRGCVMLIVEERRLVLEHTNPKGPPLLARGIDLPPDVSVSPPALGDSLSPLIVLSENGTEVFFADARRALFQIGRDRISDIGPDTDRTAGAFVNQIAEEVSLLAPLPGGFMFVGRDLAPSMPHHGSTKPIPPGWHISIAGAPPVLLNGEGPFEAHGGAHRHAHWSLIAARQAKEPWIIYESGVVQAHAQLAGPKGARVIGPWRAGGGSDTPPVLIILEADQRTISMVGARGADMLVRTPAPIVHAAIGAACAKIAYVTAAGEVGVRSLTDEAFTIHAPGSAR